MSSILFIFKIPKKKKVCRSIPLKNKGILLQILFAPSKLVDGVGVAPTVYLRGGFTVRCLRYSAHPPKMEPDIGLEPMTCWLQINRTACCANPAYGCGNRTRTYNGRLNRALLYHWTIPQFGGAGRIWTLAALRPSLFSRQISSASLSTAPYWRRRQNSNLHTLARYWWFSKPLPYRLGLRLRLVLPDGLEPPSGDYKSPVLTVELKEHWHIG